MKQFYTYMYSDPRSMVPFYVGKGHGKRAYKHLKCKNNGNLHLNNKIKQMLRESIQPLIEIAEVPSESEAFWFEADLIASIGRLDLGKGPLLNLTDGGEGCSRNLQDNPAMRIDIRAKMSMKALARPKVSCIECRQIVSINTFRQHFEGRHI